MGDGGVFYWLLKYVLLGPPLWLLFRPRVDGQQHIPADGPAIFASNHLSFSDSIFLPLVVPRHITFLAKEEYFTKPGLKGTLMRWFFAGTRQVPIDRASGAASSTALTKGLTLLNEGKLLGIYPEGTRSPDGRLYKGKAGVARLALESHVPVLPVAMIGTDKVQPIGATLPRIHRVTIRIGAPLTFPEHYNHPGDYHVQRVVTDRIMDAIGDLSGQERMSKYAKRSPR